jgi:CubicO group peptidase (beta-lactamase class C family)
MTLAAYAARPADTTAASTATDPALDALADSVAAGVYGELHQLAILRRGEPVLQQSFNGWKPDSVHAVWSVTKSVTALLVGIAIDQGQIPSVETPLSDLLP